MEGENLVRAAKFLKVNPTWLASGTGEIQPDTTAKFNQLDIEAFKKKYNISDCDEAVLFSNLVENRLHRLLNDGFL